MSVSNRSSVELQSASIFDLDVVVFFQAKDSFTSLSSLFLWFVLLSVTLESSEENDKSESILPWEKPLECKAREELTSMFINEMLCS